MGINAAIKSVASLHIFISPWSSTSSSFHLFHPPPTPLWPPPGRLKEDFLFFSEPFFFLFFLTLFCFSFHLRRHIHGERKFGGFSSNSLVVKKVEEATNQPKKKNVSTRGEVEDEEEEDHKKKCEFEVKMSSGDEEDWQVCRIWRTFHPNFFLLWLFNLNFYAFYQLQSI